jgi:hypothetical protein
MLGYNGGSTQDCGLGTRWWEERRFGANGHNSSRIAYLLNKHVVLESGQFTSPK